MQPGPVHTVLVPGLLCSGRVFGRVGPALSQFGPVTVADARSDASLAAMARRLLAAVDGPFAVAGFSMGGYVALEVARQAPERLVALGLLSTSAQPDTPQQSAARQEQIEMVRGGRFDELVDAFFGRIVASGRIRDEGLRSVWREMAAELGPDVFIRQQRAVLTRDDSRALLGTIRCPALVVHGSDDRLIGLEHGEELAAGIPGADLVVLGGCGHLSPLEEPDATAQQLASLLRRVSRSEDPAAPRVRL